MNGYQEETIYGVPISTWQSWSAFTKEKYLEGYQNEPVNCFTHGTEDGGYRVTCYHGDTTDLEKLAYTYTYGVEEITGDDVITHDTGVETGEDVNEIIETIQDLPEDLKDIYDEGKDYATLAILIGVAAFLSK